MSSLNKMQMLGRKITSQFKTNGTKLDMRRVSSEIVTTPKPHPPDSPPDQGNLRMRANTFTNGVVPRPQKSHSTPPSCTPNSVTPDDKIFDMISPRHYIRRGGIVEEDIELAINASCRDKVLVKLEDGAKKIDDSAEVKGTLSLRDILEMLFIKNDIDIEGFDRYTLTSWYQGNLNWNVDIDQPSALFAGHTIEIKAKESPRSHTPTAVAQSFQTVAECLEYFTLHGLGELPLPHPPDEDGYRLPRVQLINPIAGSWAELPIATDARNSLSKKETEQQLALWEFIETEHSHIRNLETIINVFMRCLELIRRTGMLTDDSYHNVFGYMEDIYYAHDHFWTWTIEPVLEAVYESALPLDLSVFIDNFPETFGTHFEIYEQHCQLEALNLGALKKAQENPDFAAYLEWCEAQPECHRLHLDQLLAGPMQRITRYSLLLTAIINKTTQPHIRQRLGQLCEETADFVQCVNSSIRIQEESERVRDAMNRITGFQVVDNIPHEIRDIVQPYTHLDLLAPMPGVEIDRTRMLILEGRLKYRDPSMSKPLVYQLFLFTDLLLVTKRKGGDKYTIVKEPYKIDRLVVCPLEPGSFCAVVKNEFSVMSSWFILKANTSKIASQWMDSISNAQRLYNEAVERRTQNWKLLTELQNERKLDGIDESLSASMWSLEVNRLGRCSASSESIPLKRTSSPNIKLHKRAPLTRTRSEQQTNGRVRASDFGRVSHAPSLDQLLESPKSKIPLGSLSHLGVSHMSLFNPASLDSLSCSLLHIPVSPMSVDSETEYGTPMLSSAPLRPKSMVELNSWSQDHRQFPLKSILRSSKDLIETVKPNSMKNSNSSLHLAPPRIPITRVKSDDSILKSTSLSPSPILSPTDMIPRQKSKVKFRSQSLEMTPATPPLVVTTPLSLCPTVTEVETKNEIADLAKNNEHIKHHVLDTSQSEHSKPPAVLPKPPLRRSAPEIKPPMTRKLSPNEKASSTGRVPTKPQRKVSEPLLSQQRKSSNGTKTLSQLRRPSITLGFVVQEATMEFKEPEPKEVLPEPAPRKLSSQPPKVAPKPIPNHQRSQSNYVNEYGTFTRQKVVRGKPSPPSHPKSAPNKRAPMKKQLSVDKSFPRAGSVDEHVARKQVVAMNQSVLNSKTRIGIEVGESERGIDVPSNSNTNNNSKRVRKPSTYNELAAVTVRNTSRSSLPPVRRNPADWSRFGFSYTKQNRSSLPISAQRYRTMYTPVTNL